MRFPLMSVAMLVLIAACGGEGVEPTDPPGPPAPIEAVRISAGDTVVHQFADGDTLAFYTVRFPQATEIAVFVDPAVGNFFLFADDSITRDRLGSVQARAESSAGQLLLNHTGQIQAAADQVVLLGLRPLVTGSSRARLLVYVVDRAPELTPASLAVEDTVTSETFENLADIDEYLFTAEAGDEYVLFMQDRADMERLGVVLDVRPSSNEPAIGSVSNWRQDGDIGLQGSEIITIPSSGTWFVTARQTRRTSSSEQSPGTGGYHFVLRRLNRKPEVLSAALVAGDTLEAESLEMLHDIDEFDLQVTSGETYRAFLQAVGYNGSALQLELHVPNGAVQVATSIVGMDTALARRSTASYTASSTGSVRIVVRESEGHSNVSLGRYRLFVYHVNRAPEDGPSSIAAGTVVTETIEYPGDIDEFNIMPGAGGALSALLPGLEGANLTLTMADMDPVTCPCGTGMIRSDNAVLAKVTGGSDQDLDTPYSLSTFALDPAPESAPTVITLGLPVAEAIDPPGDWDEYALNYSANQLLAFDGSSSGDRLGVNVWDSTNELRVMGGFYESGPFMLPSAGTYKVRVFGEPLPVAPESPDTYTFTIALADVGVEGGVATLSPGDSLTTEAIDELGDTDQFLVTAAPGLEVVAGVRGGNFRLQLEVFDPLSGALLRKGFPSHTGRIMVPASGQLQLRIRELRALIETFPKYNGFFFEGRYQVVLYAVDRAPETANPSLSLGVMEESERADHVGDIDEFSFAGTAGQVIAARISTPQTFESGKAIVEIVDGTTILAASPGAKDASYESTGPVTLPGTRTYTVRIRGESDDVGHGPYRFVVE